MFKHRFASALVLLFVLFASTAQAFWDPPYVTPLSPVGNESVSFNIRMGVCDAIYQWPGYPKITRDGNAIRIVNYGQHWEPGELCTFGTGTAIQSIGLFEPGKYTLTAYLQYLDFFSQPQTLSLGEVTFTVRDAAARVAPVPAISSVAMLLSIAGLLLVAINKLRGKGVCLLVLVGVVGAPLLGHAQSASNLTIQVLPTNAIGAPSATQIVNYYKITPHVGVPPLQAFAVKNPLTVQYLIPIRASGDFLVWLQTNPNSARAKLENIVLAQFATPADAATALSALRADPYVASAAAPLLVQPTSASLINFSIIAQTPLDEQYGRDDLNVDMAWQLAGGYALVAQIDTGLYMNHAALRQFSGSTYVGGNFVPSSSLDIGLTGIYSNADSLNVDEERPEFIAAGPCTPVDASLPPVNAGHGTHVSGLIAANGGSGQGVQGTCKHCGIAMWRVGYSQCFATGTPPDVEMAFNSNASDRGQAQAIDTGAQVVNLSFGTSSAYAGITYCIGQSNAASCLALAYAKARDAAMVASSGNDRIDLQFPASDPRVISAGGFQQGVGSAVAIWDESPGNLTNCPNHPPITGGLECGTDYSRTYAANGYNHQELLASAQSVLSTTYPNKNWVDYAQCGDGFPGPGWGNGVGLCTGTSMSAPQISGVVGLLRSINPLVPVGVPAPALGAALGVRAVLARTTAEAHAGQAWNATFGYGHPDAAAAARTMLGTVAGAVVHNRATPLFRLYSAVTHDYADTTSPQYALSLLINQTHDYVQPAASPIVPGYSFPYDAANEAAPATPRASVYVLTTEYRPRPEWPALLPLYLMDKPKTGGTDYLLVTTAADIEQAHAGTNGYNLRTIQGYIYQACTPEPQCIPPAAQKFYRECNTALNDCATFLESERGTFEANGYTAAYPAGSNKLLGYAYPATDSDGDGLPDGFEYVVGTNPFAASSNGDGVSDAAKFPMIGVQVSDPCIGGHYGAANCGADRIFRNGFDP